MLPFLKKDRGNSGIATEYRKPDEKPDERDKELDGIDACSEELIKAVKADDIKAVSNALRSAFEILDSEPHEEWDHDSDDSYTE